MDERIIYEKVNEVFRDVFDEDELCVTAGTTSADIDGWDSLVHVNLLISIEKVFGIKFKMEEFSALKHVGAMVKLINAYLEEKK